MNWYRSVLFEGIEIKIAGKQFFFNFVTLLWLTRSLTNKCVHRYEGTNICQEFVFCSLKAHAGVHMIHIYFIFNRLFGRKQIFNALVQISTYSPLSCSLILHTCMIFYEKKIYLVRGVQCNTIPGISWKLFTCDWRWNQIVTLQCLQL